MNKRVMPEYAIYVINKIRDAGYDAFAVGGCVRDTLMGRRPNDWDVATAAPVDVIISLFRKTVLTGVKYGTVTVLTHCGCCEVTTFRKDGDYTDNRRPEKVEFVADLREDVSRRDFTVNAMAMLPTGEIFDFFGGREDMERKIIRCVGDADTRFREDALRMFRALRFSAQLGFDIDEKTFSAIENQAHLAAGLSAERVMAETEKMLMSPRPQIIDTAVKCGLYSAYMADGTVTDGGKIAGLPKNAALRWCAFAAMAAGNNSGDFLRKLRLPKRIVRLAAACDENPLPVSNDEIRLFIARNGDETALCAAATAQVSGRRGAVGKVKKLIREGNYARVSDLEVKGDDLAAAGITGEKIGETLRVLAEAVTLGKTVNEKKVLLEYIVNK